MFKWRLAFAFLLLLIVGLASIPAQEEPLWKWIGPAAGYIETLTPDRNNPNLWFALNHGDTNTGALYRSTDGAQSWHIMNVPPGRLLLHPATSEIFVADNNHILWSSLDHGQTFQQQGEARVHAFALDPKNPNMIYGSEYSAYEEHLVVSFDRGRKGEGLGSLRYMCQDRIEDASSMGRDGIAVYWWRPLIPAQSTSPDSF